MQNRTRFKIKQSFESTLKLIQILSFPYCPYEFDKSTFRWVKDAHEFWNLPIKDVECCWTKSKNINIANI